jgi:hypothetical protein
MNTAPKGMPKSHSNGIFLLPQLDDVTADATLSNLTGVADYMEDIQ